MTDSEIIDDLIRREGSEYTDRAADKGGPTRWGITLATLREERGPHITKADVEALTEAEARDIYQRRYILRPGFGMIVDDRLRAFLVDFGVNSGPERAIKALQTAVGADVDGIFGADTLKLLETKGSAEVYAAVVAARLRLYVEIVLSDPKVKRFRVSHPDSQLANLRGWMNRLVEFL